MIFKGIAALAKFLANASPVDVPGDAEFQAWLVLAVALVVLLLIVLLFATLALCRGRRPMRRKPSDMTDAWSEAGRRLQVPKEPNEGDSDRQ